MAGNNFKIPVWTPELVNWSNQVKANNLAAAKQRQQDWNKVYDMATAYGEARKKEEEAQKARDFQAAENALQRQHQEAMQAAQIAAQQDMEAKRINAQNANAKTQGDIERNRNLAKAQGEIDVLNAERQQALGQTNNEADRANINAVYDAKIRNAYTRYGVESPKFEQVPTLNPTPVDNAPQVPREVVPNVGLTDAQIKKNTEDLAKLMKNERQAISTMKNGTEKVKRINDFNENHKNDFGITGVPAYSAEEIKKAGYVAPAFNKGQILNTKADADKAKSMGYRVAYDPTKGTWEVIRKE